MGVTVKMWTFPETIRPPGLCPSEWIDPLMDLLSYETTGRRGLTGRRCIPRVPILPLPLPVPAPLSFLSTKLGAALLPVGH